MPQCHQNYDYSNKYKCLLYVSATVYIFASTQDIL